MNKKIAVPVVLTLFIGVLAWWQVSGTSGLDQMELAATTGRVEVVRDGKTLKVDGTIALQPLDQIHTYRDAMAELRLGGDRNIELSELTAARVVDTRTIELTERGSLLATTTDPLKVVFGDVTATTRKATLRVDRGFSSVRAASYTGAVHLDAPGQQRLSLRSLFEAPISASNLPASGRPYNLDPSDSWDVELLKPLIDLEVQLEALSAGLQSQLGVSRPDLDYFGALAGRPVPFMKPYMKRKTTDLLIGFTVAHRSPAPLQPAFTDAMSYRDAGGSWGVVTGILGAKPHAVTVALDDLVVATGVLAQGGDDEPSFDPALAVASGSGSTGDGTTGGGTGGGGTGGGGTGGGGGGTGGGGGGTGGGGGGGGGGEDPPPECTTDLECTSQELQDSLPGDDGDPEPSPSPGSGGQQSGGDDPLFGDL